MFHLQETMGVEILPSVFLSLAAAGLLCLSWKAVNVLWLTPKRLEKCLRDQGFQGNPYRFLVGDLMELSKLMKDRLSIPIKLDDDHRPRTLPMEYQTINRYGENSFFWFGVTPRITIMEPDLIREILNKHETFHKIKLDTKLFVTGLVTYEGEKWTRHRRILSPVFHIEKLRYTLLSMQMSCDSMVRKWEELLSNEEYVDLDIWPFIDHMAGEAISRAAFGSSYEQGLRIFGLQKEQMEHTFDQHRSKLNQVPGLRSVPTKRSRRMKEIHKTVRALILDLIERRKSETGEVAKKEGDEDLLGILLESNRKEVGEGSTGSGSANGMPMEDVVEEVKLFYLAGQDTTASTLVWAMVLLSQHQDWQQRARDEVLQLFGTVAPHFDGLAHLKTVTMIINEVLRLYPPVTRLVRSVDEPTQLKNLSLLPGMTLYLPIIFVHKDPAIWGNDAHEFNPERFLTGVGGPLRIPGSFFPFGGGSRLCIGQNFAMVEVKMALVMILQRFSFYRSPTYTHAPTTLVSLQPQFGANIILKKLQN